MHKEKKTAVHKPYSSKYVPSAQGPQLKLQIQEIKEILKILNQIIKETKILHDQLLLLAIFVLIG